MASTQLNQALLEVDEGSLSMVKGIAKNLSLDNLIGSFNQTILDFFTLAETLSKKYKTDSFNEFKVMFNAAVKISKSLPINKYIEDILIYAKHIYEDNEEFFLTLDIPDSELTVGDSTSFLKSQKFKDIWKKLSEQDKVIVTEKLQLLTTYAHAYYIKPAK